MIKHSAIPPVPFSGKNLLLFFLIAFGFSWMFWIPQVLIARGLHFPAWLTGYLGSPYNVAAFGPFVAAFVMVYRERGRRGVVDLLKRGIQYRFPLWWYVPVLLLFPAITLLATMLGHWVDEVPADLSMLRRPGALLYWFAYMFLLGGPLQEEFGWRGYALGRLQQRFSALGSSVILGVLWAFWHFPLNYANSGAGPQYSEALMMIVGSVVTITLLSVLFTWIYNNTGGSVLAALLFHTSLNFSAHKLFPVFVSQSTIAHYSTILLAVTLAVILIFGRTTLTRT